MPIHETDLPGVGKKFVVDIDDDSQLIVIIHNTGKRELFIRDDPDQDAEKLFDLSDRLARQVGTIMEGAYFQPVADAVPKTILGEDAVIEWITVPDSSPLAGVAIGDTELRDAGDAAILAIERAGETIQNPMGSDRIKAGDTLVAVGTKEDVMALLNLVGSEGDD